MAQSRAGCGAGAAGSGHGLTGRARRMTPTLSQAFIRGFLGHSPTWYKLTIAAFLVVNPLVLTVSGFDGPIVVSWLILLEFIFTLAMALKCHPLQPGGLIALEAVLMRRRIRAMVVAELTVIALVHDPVMVGGREFGDVALVRAWGRIGTHGRTRLETCATVEEAERAASQTLRQKMRRGYLPAGQMLPPDLAV